MRKTLSIIFLIVGAVLIVWGCIGWYSEGMPKTDLIPNKNTFGTNPIHALYLGLIVIAYGVFEFWVTSSPKE